MSINKSTTLDVKRLVCTLTLTFSYTNMVFLSTTRGDNELRRAFTTAPASENIRSEGALVAGTAKMNRARDANGGTENARPENAGTGKARNVTCGIT